MPRQYRRRIALALSLTLLAGLLTAFVQSRSGGRDSLTHRAAEYLRPPV